MEKRSIRDAEQRTQTICLLILSAIGIGVALLFLRQVLVPFVLAAFLTMAVTPILDFLRRKIWMPGGRRFRMPRGMAIGVTIALASFVLVFLGGLVSTGLQDVIVKREVYVSRVSGLIEATDGWMQGCAANLEDWFPAFFPSQHSTVDPADVGLLAQEQNTGTEELAVDNSSSLIPKVGEELSQALPGDSERSNPMGLGAAAREDLKGKVLVMVGDAIGWSLDSAKALLSQGLLVMIFMMFLITGYRSSEEKEPSGLRQAIRSRVKEYLRVKILVSTLTGVATYVILRVLGVDLALVFGLAAFFLNFIPNIGSLVAIFLPVPIILLAPSEDLGVLDKILAFALPAAVQFLVGNVLEPRWMGKSLDLNPIVILMALIFWGVLWGPVGMLLSVPMTAVLKMLLERSELTQPVAVLLSEDG